LLFSIFISGCSEEEEGLSEKEETTSVQSYALTLNDFPTGFEITNNNSVNPEGFNTRVETYEVTFEYNKTDKIDIIWMTLIKYKTVENAINAQNAYEISLGNEYTNYYFTFNLHQDIIGESRYLFSGNMSSFGFNHTFYAVAMFRIGNILVIIEENQLSDLDNMVSEEICYSSALSYARIIENRMNS
jgi:hypothetical protein